MKQAVDWERVKTLRRKALTGGELTRRELDELMVAFWSDRKRYDEIGKELGGRRR